MHHPHAVGDGSHRELLVRRCAELADDRDVERQSEDPGDLGGDDDTATGNAEHDGIRTAPGGERLGEFTTRVDAVGEDGHMPTVRLRRPAGAGMPARHPSFYAVAWKGTQ